MNYYPVQYRQPAGLRRIITVVGKGSVSASPDAARIQLGVVTEDELLAQAQQENSSRMNQVIGTLRNQGVAAENIRTTAYRIEPRYDYVDGSQVFRGYEVYHEITVTVTDIGQAGALIDAAVQSGANRVVGIRLILRDQEAVYQQALQSALSNAVSKAVALAGTMQVSIDTTPINITEQSVQAVQPYAAFTLAEEAAVTPIEPGQLTITAEIEAEFAY
ncbi:SIMPL domain-containing protein [Virgibacillus sediminis]|uniref:SIMPL domain-containing protein n=1 Tax=Virgibacillus sediminis TaxID=202260 RepID=A0ABV7A1M5_9BACI